MHWILSNCDSREDRLKAEKLGWAPDQLDDVIRAKDLGHVLDLISKLAEMAPNEFARQCLAAGPVEDLLCMLDLGRVAELRQAVRNSKALAELMAMCVQISPPEVADRAQESLRS